MNHIQFDYQKALNFFREEELWAMQPVVSTLDQILREKKGLGKEFLGWLDWPNCYDKEEFDRVKEVAAKIQKDSDVLVVIGIGGSYLGARAALEFVHHSFFNALDPEKRGAPQVVFAGNNMSSTYLSDIIDLIGDRDFSVNVISKSGTTTEPAIAFRLFKNLLIKKYGQEGARKRIYATTDQKRGALREEADGQGYETFVIPEDIGGRFTVLTPVGLLPMAVSGIDIDLLMQGASDAAKAYSMDSLKENKAYQYAVVRNLFYRKGKVMELLVNYEPNLQYLAEWWKQLFGESEGKDGKGIFPVSANFSTDLHSFGQYIQDGLRNMFETVINVDRVTHQLKIPTMAEDLDGLGYLEGQTIDFVNKKAFQGTLLAHSDGQVPNFVITIPDTSPYTLGHLFYFFEISVAMSGYLNGVNPFDQPGVEAYKKNMFALLGKEGFEDLAASLNNRL